MAQSQGNFRPDVKGVWVVCTCVFLLIFVLSSISLFTGNNATWAWAAASVLLVMLCGWLIMRTIQKWFSGGKNHKNIEEALQKMRLQSSWNETLEAKMKERTAELSERNRELSVLFNFAVSMNKSLDQTEITAQYLDVIRDYVKADGVIILLVAEGSGELLIAGSRGKFIYRVCRASETAHCACRAVISEGRARSFAQRSSPGFPSYCFRNSERAAVLPLQSGRGALGVLVLAGAEDELIVKETQDLMLILCTQVSLSLERAQTQQKLSHIEAQREVERLKSQFLSSLSHELRTPLGIIKGYVATLQRKDAEIDEDVQKEFLEIIGDETQKLQSMVDTLLDAARMQAGQLPVSRKYISLGDLITTSVKRVRPSLEERGHSVNVTLPERDLNVIADPARIEQVMSNLLDNAASYSASSMPIEVAVTNQNGDALVSVKDYGVGITAEDAKSIFEPFYRGTAGAASGSRGAGLGLTICRRIVEAHDGRIWVESVPGDQTTFYFTLPIAGGK